MTLILEILKKIVEVLSETPTSRFFFRLATAFLALMLIGLIGSLLAVSIYRASAGATVEMFGWRITPPADSSNNAPAPSPETKAPLYNLAWEWRIWRAFPDLASCEQGIRGAATLVADDLLDWRASDAPVVIYAEIKGGGMLLATCDDSFRPEVVTMAKDASASGRIHSLARDFLRSQAAQASE